MKNKITNEMLVGIVGLLKSDNMESVYIEADTESRIEILSAYMSVYVSKISKISVLMNTNKNAKNALMDAVYESL